MSQISQTGYAIMILGFMTICLFPLGLLGLLVRETISYCPDCGARQGYGGPENSDLRKALRRRGYGL